MPLTPPLLIDLAGVARLAGVQRPVVSMWRSRLGASADPFPLPVEEKGGRPFFDAMSVAQWLARTKHGNNPDALADAAASAIPSGFDFAEASHVASVDALLTLHAVEEEPLSAVDVGILRRMAMEADPDDCCLAAEVSTVDPAWVHWAELLADAAYSPLGASQMLERRHASTRASDASAGPLSVDADALLISLAAALASDGRFQLVLGSGILPALALELISRVGATDVCVPERAEARGIRRRLLLDGQTLPSTQPSPGMARLFVMRLPSVDVRGSSQMLAALDEVVLGMRDDDRALVLGPAGVLTGSLGVSDRVTRADVMRSGRVRVIVRLPAGLINSAPREGLALWLLGRETGDVLVADRFTAVADLADVTLTTAARTDLASDVLASMGGARDVRAHAFRFTRLVRTTSLLASRGTLVAAAATPAPAGPSARELPALLDRARGSLPDDVPAASPAVVRGQTLAAASVESLVADRHLRVLPGARIAVEDLSATGLTVVGTDELADRTRVGARRIDPMVFAERHPSARLTAPGDVVFCTSPRPRAWIDADGSKVVAHPARVLHIDPSDPGGLVPELVAADISRSAGGPGSWRRWQLRRVTPTAIGPLRVALADLASRRSALERSIEALDTYSDLLAAGVVSGSVTLTDPAVTPASAPQ